MLVSDLGLTKTVRAAMDSAMYRPPVDSMERIYREAEASPPPPPAATQPWYRSTPMLVGAALAAGGALWWIWKR